MRSRVRVVPRLRQSNILLKNKQPDSRLGIQKSEWKLEFIPQDLYIYGPMNNRFDCHPVENQLSPSWTAGGQNQEPIPFKPVVRNWRYMHSYPLF